MKPNHDQINALNQLDQLPELSPRHYGDVIVSDVALVMRSIETAIGATSTDDGRRELFSDVLDTMTRQIRRVALDAFDQAAMQAAVARQQGGRGVQ